MKRLHNTVRHTLLVRFNANLQKNVCWTYKICVINHRFVEIVYSEQSFYYKKFQHVTTRTNHACIRILQLSPCRRIMWAEKLWNLLQKSVADCGVVSGDLD